MTTDFGGSDVGEALIRQPDGKLVVAGFSESSTETDSIALARYLAAPGIPCPIVSALRGVPERDAVLQTLYRFRDEVMTQIPEGRRHIELFYRHAWEGTWLLLSHPRIRRQVHDLLVRLLPTLQAVVAGQPAAITPAELAELEGVFDAIAVEASPQLRADLRALQEAFRHGTILQQMGIRISD